MAISWRLQNLRGCYGVNTAVRVSTQWRIRGGGANRPRPPFFRVFFLLFTPEVGLVGGRYPYPIMYMSPKKIQKTMCRSLDSRPSLLTNPGSASATSCSFFAKITSRGSYGTAWPLHGGVTVTFITRYETLCVALTADVCKCGDSVLHEGDNLFLLIKYIVHREFTIIMTIVTRKK